VISSELFSAGLQLFVLRETSLFIPYLFFSYLSFSLLCGHSTFLSFSSFFPFFQVILEFELRALSLVGRYTTTRAMPPAPHLSFLLDHQFQATDHKHNFYYLSLTNCVLCYPGILSTWIIKNSLTISSLCLISLLNVFTIILLVSS
jgi:hypothetical protein